MSWIDDVVKAHSESETPERFYYWSAMAVLSACVGSNIFLERYYYKLYPNIYVVIVSKRSGLRKGVAVSAAKRILREVNSCRIVEGRNTIQSVIREFSLQTTLESGAVISDAQGILVSGELDTFLQKNDEALTILTDLHNTHEHMGGGWKNSIKGGKEGQISTEILKNPCVTLLGASNEVLFEDVIQDKDIEGGFIARTFIVHESRRARINPLVDAPEIMVSTKDLADYLKRVVVKLKGGFKWSPGAGLMYKKWYESLCNMEIEDKTGTVDRLGDQALKAAMLLSVAKRGDLVIEQDDLEEAIFRAEECVPSVSRMTAGSGKSPTAHATKRVLHILLDSPGYMMTRKRILQVLWPDVDSETLNKIVDTLEAAGAVQNVRVEGQLALVVPKEIAAQYRNFKAEK